MDQENNTFQASKVTNNLYLMYWNTISINDAINKRTVILHQWSGSRQIYN